MTTPSERLEGTVDPKLLEILVCPLTKGPLEFDAAKQELISRSAKLAYPIRDGIPIMLPEEARKIDWSPRIALVIAQRCAKQSISSSIAFEMDCFAEPVIGRRYAPTRWLAMTVLRLQ